MLYTTYEGQTAKIMRYIKKQLDTKYECDLVKLDKTTEIKLTNYQAIIIGTSIRYGNYHKLIKHFIASNYQQLNQMIGAFFGVNLVARKPHKNTPQTNSYTKKFLATIKWQPKLTAVFAGALYYPQYNLFERNVIRLIMWLGRGDTDIKKSVIEYTSWQQVDEFAENFRQLTKP